jgi:hypothetical protein
MPAQNEIGARAATPDAPVQVIFVRLPADAPLQPGEPRPAARPKRAPVKGKARRSPARGRRKRQEKKTMIKTVLAIVCALAVYVVLGSVLPPSGAVAVTFPVLRAIPALGAWLCFLTFKGIASLCLFSYVAK